ncbi:hypothetical protein DERP_007974 [Dermatophagoides pteronyssinus]|uniref:Uncharacterized protein n=1 Tax=Dermatophagoides pteronyssinus TaxID=6956 RepID=A0ABQ8IT50_DERPT|nr:hypothetical protein DERP_007974 [Dermatophagoides pteronyssinus]
MIPGRTSISMPTVSTPLSLFTSKDRIMMSLGGDTKSRSGMGILLHMDIIFELSTDRCLSRIISTAAKCSEVCGCGHDSLAAINTNAASITAAPFNMVAIRMS